MRRARWHHCSASDSQWDHGQMKAAAAIMYCNTQTSIPWFVRKVEDCFWATSTSLHSAAPSSANSACLCDSQCRLWAGSLETEAVRALHETPGSHSLALAHPQFPWLPSPVLSTSTTTTPASTSPSQQASTAPPTAVLTSALDIMSQGTPSLPKMLTNHNTN